MKNLSKVKLLLIMTMILSMLVAFAACDNTPDEELVLPEFSIQLIDGDNTITITEEDIADLDLYTFSNTSKDITSYYKGIKISELVATFTDIETEITSLLVIAEGGYGIDKPALPSQNFANAYFALFYSETEEGEYELLAEDNGPVRLFDTTEGTEVKSIKQVVKIAINGVLPEEAVLPEFSIDFNDGETTITITEEDIEDLDLHNFSNTSKGVTSYYKGVKISELLETITSLENKNEITALLILAVNGYGDTQPALPAANFENAYFALFYCETEDGEYELLAEDNGPVRSIDTTQDTDVKSIKQVAEVEVQR